MNKALSIVIAMNFFLFSCASHHSGEVAVAPEPVKDLVVSAEKISEMSDAKHTMIVFTFENKDGDWTRFKSTSFSCGEDCDNETNIILGSDLRAWTQSQFIKRNVTQYNDTLLYAGMVVVGFGAAIVGASSNNEGLMNTGLAAATAGSTMDTYNQFSKAHLATKTGNLNEYADHIYNPFAVPAAGYARKWILINTPKNRKVNKINLTLETIDGEQKQYAVKL